MTVKEVTEVSEGELAAKLGKQLTKMSPYLRALVLSGGSTMTIDGTAYRACSAEHLELIHKHRAAPRVLAEVFEPKGEKRRDLVAEYHAEVAAERALEPRDEPPSPARELFATERPTVKRTMPETNHELRVRLQREADARHAARQGKRPPAGSTIRAIFEGRDPKDAA